MTSAALVLCLKCGPGQQPDTTHQLKAILFSDQDQQLIKAALLLYLLYCVLYLSVEPWKYLSPILLINMKEFTGIFYLTYPSME